MNKLITSACASLALLAGAALAGNGQGHPGGALETPPADTALLAQASAEMTEGEVRKVDKENKKITLKHGEIKNLGMPSMTMVFQVRDPALLDNVQPGAKVRFTAERAEGAFVVTGIEPAK